MKKHSMMTFGLIIISIIVILNGCNHNEVTTREQSTNKNIEEVSEEFKSIYDDEERIVNNSGGAYYSEYALDRQNKDNISESIAGYYGAVNYWVLDAKSAGKITLNYNFEFSKEGKYKLLLCTPDKKLVKIFEHTLGDDSVKNETTIDIKKGVTRIVAVGNNATAKVDISIKTQGDIEIKNK
ncbi:MULTISPECIES: hypothetical protein [unclassified Clostridium]|uniref:hypothetical protein n=1 Tax=unclassified Clostridium TaxID=2614128 RepID=UPI0025BFFEC7|nr:MULTISPECIES: hypothetical protein [unclassified Clostridium]